MNAGHFEDVFEIQNLVLWVAVKTDKLQKFCPNLPADFLAFYQTVTSAMLCYDNWIRILSPDEIIELERDLRDEDECPKGVLPRLVRFAETWQGDHFALRTEDAARTEWLVILAPNYDGTQELEGDEGSRCRTDAGFSELLMRILRTQCNPMIPRPEFPEQRDERTAAILFGQRWRLAEVGFLEVKQQFRRRYRSTRDYLDRMLSGIERMAALAGEDRWTREVEVHSSMGAGDEADGFTVRDMLL